MTATAAPASITSSITPSRDLTLERHDEQGWGTVTESMEIRQRDYLRSNPSDDYRAVEQQRDALGTLYLDPASGIAYRLTGYYTNWTSRESEPSYSMLLPEGAQSRTTELPAEAVAIWSPAAI